jgi:hypothetical protein
VKRVLKVIEDLWTADQEHLAFCTRCYACKKHALFWLNKEPSIGSPLLFVCGVTRVKSLSVLLSKGPPVRSSLLFARGATCVNSISFF